MTLVTRLRSLNVTRLDGVGATATKDPAWPRHSHPPMIGISVLILGRTSQTEGHDFRKIKALKDGVIQRSFTIDIFIFGTVEGGGWFSGALRGLERRLSYSNRECEDEDDA